METQERIKDRVLKRAARVWGYTDNELETSFDPVVAMLLDACSSEMEKLSSKLDDSHTRIIERMLEIMSPVANTGILPAHAIIHALPLENNLQLSLEHQLHCTKNITNVYDPINPIIKEIFFGPTAPFTLSTAELQYLAYGESMYDMTRNIHKDFFMKAEKHLKPATLWLGVKCHEKTDVLENLMFYTDIKTSYQKEVFYHYLKQAKFYVGEKEIPCKEGYNVKTTALDVEAVITKNYNRINQIYAEVNQFYESKFIHFTENIKLAPELLQTPVELGSAFNAEKMAEMQDILWIRIEFPEVMINDILDNIFVSTNAFPVINKKLLGDTQNVDQFLNYIPLKTDDHFLDLESISDSNGGKYHLKDFSDGKLESGNATLRSDGVVRFDERNASELIQYLLELLKDESASFSVLGGDFVKSMLEQINQLLASLEQEAKEKLFTKSNFPYVIIKPFLETILSGNETFAVNYWSSCGEEANNLKPSTQLYFTSNDFANGSAYLVTSTVGGKTRISSREKILSYREALLTHGRIVTFADIKAYTLNHFKNTINKVEIKKGTKKDASLKTGFIRTVDIIMEQNTDLNPQLSKEEWNYLVDNFMHKLNQASANIYPYRLLVN